MALKDIRRYFRGLSHQWSLQLPIDHHYGRIQKQDVVDLPPFGKQLSSNCDHVVTLGSVYNYNDPCPLREKSSYTSNYPEI